jgi:hypothetical protein
MTCKEAVRRLEALEREAASSRVDDGEVAAAADREPILLSVPPCATWHHFSHQGPATWAPREPRGC